MTPKVTKQTARCEYRKPGNAALKLHLFCKSLQGDLGKICFLFLPGHYANKDVTGLAVILKVACKSVT